MQRLRAAAKDGAASVCQLTYSSQPTRPSQQRGEKKEFPVPAHEAALTNTYTRAGRPRAQTFVNQMFTCRCSEDRRGEPAPARLFVCLSVFIRLHVNECDWSIFFSVHLVLSRCLAVLKQPALSCSRAQLPRGSTQVRRWRSAQPDVPPQSRPSFFYACLVQVKTGDPGILVGQVKAYRETVR